MPPRSRRALLELLGAGTAALLAGCGTDPSTGTPTDGSTPTASPTATRTATASGSGRGTATSTGRPAELDCDAVSRPETAWPVPRRSPARDGYVADWTGFETPPSVDWEVEPSDHGDSTAFPTYGQPVVAGDGLFVTNRLDKGPEVPTYGHVHALETTSGDRRWHSERLRSPSHPVVWGDLAVVVAEHEPGETMVVAFDRADGSRRWTRRFAARDWGFVAAGNHLYLALEEDSDRGTIRALAADGSTVWSSVGAFADHVNEGPAVGADTVYVGTREGRLHALDRGDGTTRWTHPFQHPTERRPFVTDLVATGCGAVAVVEGGLAAVDDAGTPVWELAGDHGPIAVDDETVYVATNLDAREREFRALSVATGEVRWTVRGSVETFQSAVVAGTSVLVRSDESIVALDRTDGTERWRTDGALDDVALAGGTVYGTTRRNLRAVR